MKFNLQLQHLRVPFFFFNWRHATDRERSMCSRLALLSRDGINFVFSYYKPLKDYNSPADRAVVLVGCYSNSLLGNKDTVTKCRGQADTTCFSCSPPDTILDASMFLVYVSFKYPCIRVFKTTATGWKPNCSWINIILFYFNPVKYITSQQNKLNFTFTTKCSTHLRQQRMLKCGSECIFYKT